MSSSPQEEASNLGEASLSSPSSPVESPPRTSSSDSAPETIEVGYCWCCLHHRRPRVRRTATLVACYFQRPEGPIATRTRRRTGAPPAFLTWRVRPVCDLHARFFATLLCAGDERAADSVPWLLGALISTIEGWSVAAPPAAVLDDGLPDDVPPARHTRLVCFRHAQFFADLCCAGTDEEADGIPLLRGVLVHSITVVQC
ncbi:hypothetical protein CYMTET_26874 [Cymbomonas tetramitiformis]|uniref:Uncharacterized protein n=1 Tax=Cymbomonas tetramitiformis TaxID=36881 RepID=A0AAE0FR81_9CHLO|nr:hypothetical protein CYMTET_26874 [Cymbomonas tetramitiformis]